MGFWQIEINADITFSTTTRDDHSENEFIDVQIRGKGEGNKPRFYTDTHVHIRFRR
jgi:hypothetical protein